MAVKLNSGWQPKPPTPAPAPAPAVEYACSNNPSAMNSTRETAPSFDINDPAIQDAIADEVDSQLADEDDPQDRNKI
jgi:hypothetical protein